MRVGGWETSGGGSEAAPDSLRVRQGSRYFARVAASSAAKRARLGGATDAVAAAFAGALAATSSEALPLSGAGAGSWDCDVIAPPVSTALPRRPDGKTVEPGSVTTWHVHPALLDAAARLASVAAGTPWCRGGVSPLWPALTASVAAGSPPHATVALPSFALAPPFSPLHTGVAAVLAPALPTPSEMAAGATALSAAMVVDDSAPTAPALPPAATITVLSPPPAPLAAAPAVALSDARLAPSIPLSSSLPLPPPPPPPPAAHAIVAQTAAPPPPPPAAEAAAADDAFPDIILS